MVADILKGKKKIVKVLLQGHWRPSRDVDKLISKPPPERKADDSCTYKVIDAVRPLAKPLVPILKKGIIHTPFSPYGRGQNHTRGLEKREIMKSSSHFSELFLHFLDWKNFLNMIFLIYFEVFNVTYRVKKCILMYICIWKFSNIFQFLRKDNSAGGD